MNTRTTLGSMLVAAIALLFIVQQPELHAQMHARVIKADSLWSAPWILTGKGYTVGMFEVGGYAEASHQQFTTKRVILPPLRPVGGTAKHATNVASMLVASGKHSRTQYKGIIHEGQLKSYYVAPDSIEAHMFKRLFALENWSVSNHSYGRNQGWRWHDSLGMWQWGARPLSASHPDPFGAYMDESRVFDSVTHAANYVLPVVAAGNDKWDGPNIGDSVLFRTDALGWHFKVITASDYRLNGGLRGYDCLSAQASAKNVLTVGALSRADTLASFSNTGPTNDGRIKPDVVALGDRVLAAGESGVTNGYTITSGTSFAAPAAAGVAVQLQQLFRRYFGVDPLPSTIKALIIHTARDIGNTGPDYRHGWGVIDALKAARQLETANNDSVFSVNEFRLKQNNNQHFYIKAVNANTPIVVTIAWSDPAATVTEGGAVLNTTYSTTTTPKLVHDIDLFVDWKENNLSYFSKPWVLDPTRPHLPATRGTNTRDNVEQVVIANPVPGRIYRVNIVTNLPLTTPDQLFSRCISGATLHLPAPESVKAATTPSVDNKGDETQAFNVNVSWERVPEAVTYTLRYRRSGANTWTTLLNIPSNTRLVEGLDIGSYQFQVRAHRAKTVSTWKTTSKTFSVTPVTPKNLASSNITPTSARLSWVGDANASSYRVFFSELDANNNLEGNGWLTFNTAATFLVRANLKQDAKYAWSVQSVYSADIKSESANTVAFWTSTNCESYEPNNAIAQAASIEVNRNITSRSCTDDVSDWYSFVVPGSQRNVKVTLYQQPVPIKLALYRIVNGNATLVVDSPDNNNGTSTKSLVANGLLAGETYYVRLHNQSGPYANGQTYSFRVNTKATAW